MGDIAAVPRAIREVAVDVIGRECAARGLDEDDELNAYGEELACRRARAGGVDARRSLLLFLRRSRRDARRSVPFLRATPARPPSENVSWGIPRKILE